MKFYTYAPIEYPFILRNIKQKPKKWFLHEIVDIGIYDLLKPPHQHSEKKLLKWKNHSRDRSWKVVPDCPDIDGEYNIRSKIDNIEYSKELMEKYYIPGNPEHLPVIQGNYDNPGTFKKYGEWVLKNYPMPQKIAVGTCCKASDSKAVKEIFLIARGLFPKSKIHAFGLKMNHYSLVSDLIDSWDSMSWTFPRGKGQASAKNKKERETYFVNYLQSIPKQKKIIRLEL